MAITDFYFFLKFQSIFTQCFSLSAEHKIENRIGDQVESTTKSGGHSLVIASNSDKSESGEIKIKQPHFRYTPLDATGQIQNHSSEVDSSRMTGSVSCRKDTSNESHSRTTAVTCFVGSVSQVVCANSVQSKKPTVIDTPLLRNNTNFTSLYGYQTPPTIVYNVDVELQDAPLTFTTHEQSSALKSTGGEQISVEHTEVSVLPNEKEKKNIENNSSDYKSDYLGKDNVLSIPYSDSSDSNEDFGECEKWNKGTCSR